MKTGVCVYCGALGLITRDHVPPKCLFTPPLPSNLITVPACPACHDTFKKDDEYFRLCLSMRQDVIATPSGQKLWEASLRSLTKPQAVGLKNTVLASMRQVALHTPAGLYLGHAPGFRISPKRFKVTARRILYGLFYKAIGHRLPDTHEASIYYEEFQKDRRALESPEFKEALDALAAAPLHELGNVLSYKYVRLAEDSNATVWVVQILNAISFFGFTIPYPARIHAN